MTALVSRAARPSRGSQASPGARAALAVLVLLGAALPACGRKTAPVAPPPASPKVVVVQPPARSAGYAYDGQIWALFDRALDPRSVDSTTVFLKQDTRRMSCAIGYEPTSRRVVVVPRTALELNKTYTVIVTALVRGKDGSALGEDYSWQFSTSSIRRLDYLNPVAGEVASPVAMLRWASADATPGTLSFDVYAGPDSVAVHARTAPMLARTTNTYYLPRQYWPQGQRTYWAVTTTNVTTGERILSPVAGFGVLPPGAPTHEVLGPAIEWGGIRSGATTQYCTQNAVIAGLGYNNAVRFNLDPGLMGTRVKSARLVMYVGNNFHQIPFVSAWSCSPTWFPCAFTYPGPPFIDPNGQLATASYGALSNEMVFDSVGLAAWVEGMLRRGEFSGLMFTLPANYSIMSLNMSGPAGPRPLITVTVYD